MTALGSSSHSAPETSSRCPPWASVFLTAIDASGLGLFDPLLAAVMVSDMVTLADEEFVPLDEGTLANHTIFLDIFLVVFFSIRWVESRQYGVREGEINCLLLSAVKGHSDFFFFINDGL